MIVRVLMFNDIHLFAPHALKIDVVAKIKAFKVKYPSGIVVYNGDVVDLNGCKHKDVNKAEVEKTYIQALCSYVCNGNHELEFYKDQEAKIGRHLFSHGHNYFWPIKKIAKWAKKKPGRSHFMRALAWAYSNWRMLKQPKITNEHMDRAIKLADSYECKIIHSGHRHPSKIISKIKRGIKVVVYPRGAHEFDIEL